MGLDFLFYGTGCLFRAMSDSPSSSNETPIAVRGRVVGGLPTAFEQSKLLLSTPNDRVREQRLKDDQKNELQTPVPATPAAVPRSILRSANTITSLPTVAETRETPESSNRSDSPVLDPPVYDESLFSPELPDDGVIPGPPVRPAPAAPAQPAQIGRRRLAFQEEKGAVDDTELEKLLDELDAADKEKKYEPVAAPVNPLLNEFKSQPVQPSLAPVPAPAPARSNNFARLRRVGEFVEENRPKLKRTLNDFDGIETEEQAEERAAQLRLAQKVNKVAAKAYSEFRANKTPLLERLWGNQVETENSAENWIVILLLLAVLGTMIAVLVTAGKKTSASGEDNSDLQRGEATLWLVSTLALGLAFMYGILAAGFVGRILLIASWITYTVYALKALAS